jgi:hypothetical protein
VRHSGMDGQDERHRGGGSAAGTPRGAGAHGAWLRSAGSTPLFQQWRADAADAWAPVGGGRGGEEQGTGARGPTPG